MTDGSSGTVSIRENAAEVEARIARACERAGRSRSEVTLVAVSKTFPAEFIDEAIEAGITEVGENRVQEARDKKPLVRGSARWHLIGHLQTNKSKDAVKLFDVIQAVDSLELAEKLARAAGNQGKRLEIMLQVNIGDEPQKSGIARGEVDAVAKQAAALASLDVIGLMAIPPIGTPEESRPYFRELRSMRDALGLKHLSMGMSEDFETAIEEGSTIVRVGRAIFGTRG
ncbi:MAG: YggS family pyridoxal phosphate-dependent enzyme [Acidobacteria bacterium]|nr:YggS family pyridoxal phosphate-dependent enzyme [Acidobacteriota bacterium]MBV9071480.1 YggS family pyridoxal phosphate-dependent enzyme [Acidobacteriota bacterium]MBV9187445.1 YggS family pyridoxal phosphate-dependent enzyme [Acidobacteriota bacterium]